MITHNQSLILKPPSTVYPKCALGRTFATPQLDVRALADKCEILILIEASEGSPYPFGVGQSTRL